MKNGSFTGVVVCSLRRSFHLPCCLFFPPPILVSFFLAISGFFFSRFPSRLHGRRGGTRRRVLEAIWRESRRRRKKTRGVFVVGFTNASASIHGSLCVEQRRRTCPSFLLLCTAHSTKLIGKRFGSFLGDGAGGFSHSLMIRRVLLTFLCFPAAVPWIEVRASAQESTFSLSQGTEFRRNRCCWTSLASTPSFFVSSLPFFTVGEGGIRRKEVWERLEVSLRATSQSRKHTFSVLWSALDA